MDQQITFILLTSITGLSQAAAVLSRKPPVACIALAGALAGATGLLWLLADKIVASVYSAAFAIMLLCPGLLLLRVPEFRQKEPAREGAGPLETTAMIGLLLIAGHLAWHLPLPESGAGVATTTGLRLLPPLFFFFAGLIGLLLKRNFVMLLIALELILTGSVLGFGLSSTGPLAEPARPLCAFILSLCIAKVLCGSGLLYSCYQKSGIVENSLLRILRG